MVWYGNVSNHYNHDAVAAAAAAIDKVPPILHLLLRSLGLLSELSRTTTLFGTVRYIHPAPVCHRRTRMISSRNGIPGNLKESNSN